MKIAALLALAILLFASLPVRANDQDPVHLGQCEPKQTVMAPDGRRGVVFECDSGAVVIVPAELLEKNSRSAPAPIPPSEDGVRI